MTLNKRYLLIILTSLCSLVKGGDINFEIVTSNPPAPQISFLVDDLLLPDFEFGDIDNDGDDDLVLTGQVNAQTDKTAIYKNDGNGSFKQWGEELQAVKRGLTRFGDIDNDGDLDLLVSGRGVGANGAEYFAGLYKNDGQGNFTLYNDSTINGAWDADAKFADIDGDNDLDIFILGAGKYIGQVNMYINDGLGNYSIKSMPSITWATEVEIFFHDLDNDNDLDLSIVSDHQYYGYINDGSGNFEVTTRIKDQVSYSGIGFGDVDNDGDIDAIEIGKTSTWEKRFFHEQLGVNSGNFYARDISGNFFLSEECVVQLEDINGDDNLDVILSGKKGFDYLTELYLCNGDMTYTRIDTASIYACEDCKLKVNDVDGDNDLDIVVIGKGRTELYINDGTANFRVVEQSIFTGFWGETEFVDLDNDNDLDIISIGSAEKDGVRSNIYINEGNGSFLAKENSGLVQYGEDHNSMELGDIDGDGDLDVVFTGTKYLNGSSTVETTVYLNNGDATFNDPLSLQYMPAVTEATLSFGDIDSDGDLDLFMSGEYGSTPTSYLFLNDGAGKFTEVSGHGIMDVAQSASQFLDVDGDNDQDLIVAGQDSNSKRWTKLYLNDGSGSFSESASNFIGQYWAYINVLDVDLDNDLDLLISGQLSNPDSTVLYINDGLGNYTEKLHSGIPSIVASQFDTLDINKDGLVDLLLVGNERAELYINKGNATFLLYPSDLFIPFANSATGAVGDTDGDGDVEVLITGRNFAIRDPAYFYRNISCVPQFNSELVQNILVCAGDSFVYVDGTVAHNIMIDENRTHVIPGGSASGCDSTISQFVKVTSIDDSTQLVNDEITCYQSDAAYQWLNCNSSYTEVLNEDSQSFTAKNSGSYAAKISLNGCIDTTDCHSIIITNSAAEILDFEVKAHPNPSDGLVSITMHPNTRQTTVIVLTLTGQVIESSITFGSNFIVELPASSGTYVVQLTNQNINKVVKLIRL
jgi:hypothetical protein